MAKKEVTTFFFQAKKKDSHGSRELSDQEICDLFDYLKSLNLKKTEDSNTRYIEIENKKYFLEFSNDNPNILVFNDCISGVFARDRLFNYPLQSDNNCALSKIDLNSEDNTITETTCFLFYKPTKTFVWLNNRNVSGIKIFSTYINILIMNRFKYSIEILPIANKNMDNMFKKSTEVRSYNYKIQDTADNVKAFNEGSTEDQINHLIDCVDNDFIKTIEVIINFRNPESSSNLDKIKGTLRKIAEKYKLIKSKTKLVYDGEALELDMLDPNLYVKSKFELSEKYVDFKTIFNLLYSQLLSNKDNIIAALPGGKDGTIQK